jgi:hypothetical protein
MSSDINHIIIVSAVTMLAGGTYHNFSFNAFVATEGTPRQSRSIFEVDSGQSRWFLRVVATVRCEGGLDSVPTSTVIAGCGHATGRKDLRPQKAGSKHRCHFD